MGFSVVLLTNPMWCSIVFALIGNHMRNHSGEHFVDSQGAAIKENVFFSELVQDCDTMAL